MFFKFNYISEVCYIESAPVILRSRNEFINPSGECRQNTNRKGFLFFTWFKSAEGPGRGQTLSASLLDQVTSVLGYRKPRGTALFFLEAFSFFFLFSLRLVCFPVFFLLKISL